MAEEILTAQEEEAAQAVSRMPRFVKIMLRPEDKKMLAGATVDSEMKIAATGKVRRMDLSEFSATVELEVDALEILEPQSQSQMFSDFQIKKVLGT